MSCAKTNFCSCLPELAGIIRRLEKMRCTRDSPLLNKLNTLCRDNYFVGTFMQRIADTGRLVIATLTQPSPRQLMAFTSVQLLKRGGETVYFGPVGTNAELLRVSI